MIQISLLGCFKVSNQSGAIADIHTKRGCELFAFLVLEADRRFHRTRLVEQFWNHLPETRGRRALNTELWRISTALRHIGMDVGASFHKTQTEVGYISQPDHHIDVNHLQAAMAITGNATPENVDATGLKLVEEGIASYQGDLLESGYSDWCLLWRESLRAMHTEALEFMLKASMARKDWNAGLRYGRQLLMLDSLMEHVHRAVMRCHFHNGNRPLAMRQYALCEQLLREELDVEPMDETRRIQETILAVTPRPSKAVLDHMTAPTVRRSKDGRSPAQKVDMALANINTARTWLEDASYDMRTDRKPKQ